jgi:hypothetical protein
MTRYVTASSFRAWARDDVTADDDLIGEAIEAAEEWLDEELGRYIYPVTGSTSATARTYVPGYCTDVLHIHDAASVSSVVENSITLVEGTDYQLEPLSNVSVNGNEYRPYDVVRRLPYGQTWYTDGPVGTVVVTAKWGWTSTSIPSAASQAIRFLASDWLANRDVRGGVIGSTTDGFSIGVRTNPNVMRAVRRLSSAKSVEAA